VKGRCAGIVSLAFGVLAMAAVAGALWLVPTWAPECGDIHCGCGCPDVLECSCAESP
jgi:hypothetical protein